MRRGWYSLARCALRRESMRERSLRRLGRPTSRPEFAPRASPPSRGAAEMKSGSDLAALVRALSKNLLAGARLALFLPVRPLDFRFSAAQCFALVVSCLALWLALGVLQQGIPGNVDLGALTVALAWIPVLLGACLLAARLFRDARLAGAFAVAFLAVVP